jgi:D-serine deaminase-like pyridoxal phosphate-dependent protein
MSAHRGTLTRKKSALSTPALLLDLDAMERNLGRMMTFCREASVGLRPHYKNHKSVTIAKRQIAAGAIGVTCATLREAQVLVRAGVDHILIANEIAGTTKIDQFAELARHAEVIVAVDHIDTVRALADASVRHSVPLDVLVDVDIRLQRCGVSPGDDVLQLTRQVIACGLRFRGLMGYEGRLPFAPGAEKENALAEAMQKLLGSKQLLEANNIAVELVSVGSTGSSSMIGRHPGITEIQPGSFIVMDTAYRSLCDDFDPALTILATVISKRDGERIVLDAGVKSVSTDRGLPTIKNLNGMRVHKVNAEHTIVTLLDPSMRMDVGDQVEMWVPCGDTTVFLHDVMYGVRGDSVEEQFSIEG